MNSDQVGALARRALLALAFTFCAFAFVCSHASAQGADDPAYKDLIEQALSEFKHKNWPEARVLFRRAHERSPNARTLRGMGVVSFEMRDYVQAVRELSLALADTRQPLTDAQKNECEGLLARARTFVGVFALHVSPSDAHVALDGVATVRERDESVLVPFGEHSFRASAPGYQDSTTRIVVQGGERGEVSIVLLADSAQTPAQAHEPSPITRELPTSAPSESREDERAGPDQTSAGFSGRGLRYTWVALGAGAAFGGAGAALWLVGQSKFDELDASCKKGASMGAPCQRGRTDTGDIKLYERLTNASLGLSAAALVASGVFLALEWPRERNLALGIGPQSVSLHGSF